MAEDGAGCFGVVALRKTDNVGAIVDETVVVDVLCLEVFAAGGILFIEGSAAIR